MRDQFRKVLLIGWQEPLNIPIGANPILHLPCEGDDWESWKKRSQVADNKASYYGKKYRDTYTYLYFFSVLAVVFGVINAGLKLEHQWAILFPCGELFSLAAIAWFYRSEKKNDWHNHWIHQRFHAEYLRCLPLICLENPDNPIYKSYGNVGATERKQLHEKLFLSSPSVLKCMNYGIALAKNQYWYFARTCLREKFIGNRVEKLSYVLFTITVVAVIMEFFVHTGWIMVITTLLPAATASLHGAMEAEESERLERRYKVMEDSMKDWLAKYDSCADEVIARTGMRELVDLLLSEVEGWHKLMKDRSIHIG